MDPQQELFTWLKLHIEEAGYDVYDGPLPPDGTPYPFVYLGESQQVDDANKNAVFGTVYQMIHVWHDSPEKRGTLSRILLDIKQVCRQIAEAENFNWYVRSIDQQIREDPTTRTPLLHGILNVEFRFS